MHLLLRCFSPMANVLTLCYLEERVCPAACNAIRTYLMTYNKHERVCPAACNAVRTYLMTYNKHERVCPAACNAVRTYLMTYNMHERVKCKNVFFLRFRQHYNKYL